MKIRFCAGVLFAGVSMSAGFASDPIGLLPGEKVPVAVAPDERNPFGRRTPKVAEAPVESTETEESQIRGVLERLVVTGITHGKGGARVLLGSLALQEGRELPPVISGQSEKLRVLSLQDGRIEIGFVERDGTAETRRISLSADLTPTVRFALGSKNPKPPESPSQDAEFGGVIRKNEPPPAP